MADLSGWFLRPPDTGGFDFDPGTPGRPPDVEAMRDRLRARLDGIRERLLNSPYPLPPKAEMSPVERLALANTCKEWGTVMSEIRQARTR
jgi:hypothetical protein